MSYADQIFIQNCNDILEHGVWDTDYDVRPVWEDGTPGRTPPCSQPTMGLKSA